MAPLQRPGRLGKPDQGTGRTVWDQAAVRGKLLGHGSTAPPGHRRLQPLCAFAAAIGAVGKMRIEHPALAIVWTRRSLEPDRRQTHPQTGRAGGPPIATGGAKCWPNSPRYPTAMQLTPFK